MKKNKEKPTKQQWKEDEEKVVSKLVIPALVGCIGILAFLLMLPLKDSPEETFAYQNEEVKEKSINVPCSSDYKEELSHFPGCVPKTCGRVVFDSLIDPSHISVLRKIAKDGIALAGSSGGASILDLHSGALSQNDVFVNFYKVDGSKELFTSEDSKIYSLVKDKIKSSIANHFGVSQSELYLTHPTFFSRITNVSAKTIHDEYWHPHVDKETYESFHYTSLLYLSDYSIDFSGGRFIFIDKESNKTIEPKLGRLSAFTSGSENLHQVEKVTNGTRYAITVSFTCNPKHAIQDPNFL